MDSEIATNTLNEQIQEIMKILKQRDEREVERQKEQDEEQMALRNEIKHLREENLSIKSTRGDKMDEVKEMEEKLKEEK